MESDNQPNGMTKPTILKEGCFAQMSGTPYLACRPTTLFVLLKDTDTRPALLSGAPPCLKFVFFIISLSRSNVVV